MTLTPESTSLPTSAKPSSGSSLSHNRGTLRIHFSSADLARLQVSATLGPIAESIFAIGLVGRRVGPVFGEWQQGIQASLDAYWPMIRRIALRLPNPVMDLLWLLERQEPMPDGPIVDLGLSRSQVGTAVRVFAQCAVVPYWQAILRYLESERDARGRLLMTGGIEQLFETLGPRIRWSPPVLEIPAAHDGDLYLEGCGLLLAPSLFLFRTPAVLVHAHGSEGRPVLAFSTPPDLSAANTLWSARTQVDEPVDALVGRTRARLLRQTLVIRTTGELAEQLGVSAAAISQHTRVLREAGLISTFRSKNRVLHSITELGAAVIGRHARIASFSALSPANEH